MFKIKKVTAPEFTFLGKWSIFRHRRSSYILFPSYDAVDGVDALILVTEWREFSNPDFKELKKLMKGNFIFDGRNLISKRKSTEEGFKYFGIGR